jgi:hypothetical protein
MKDCNGKHKYKDGFKVDSNGGVLRQCGECGEWLPYKFHKPKDESLYHRYALKTKESYYKVVKKLRSNKHEKTN